MALTNRMMLILLLCLIVMVVLYIGHVFLIRRGKPPGPFGLPFLGYLPFINKRKPYESFTYLARRYGSIYGLWMGQVYTVVLSDPNLIRSALSKEESTGRAPLFVTHGIMGGHGIICAQGDLWRDQRRLSIEWLRRLGMIKFGNARLDLENRIIESINELTLDIDASIEHANCFDPTSTIHHALGNLMNDLVFGMKYEKHNSTWLYLQHLQEEGVKHIGVSMAVNFLPFLRYFPSTKRVMDFLLRGKTETHKIYDKIIANERQKLVNQTGTECRDKCILTSFLKEAAIRQNTGRPDAAFCSDTQLRHLMADLFGAGVDTTFTTLRWALLFIALNPTVQQRLREELEQRLPPNEAPTLNNMDELPYLRATITEVQRIRTVVPVGIPHGTIKDMTIAGYQIPSNTMIMPLLWAVHMDSTVFAEPTHFNPERFLDSEGRFVTPNCFMPFQVGKRMCLGEELARSILLLFIAHIVLCYSFKIPQKDICSLDLTGNCGITLTPPSYRIIFSKNSNCVIK